MFKKILAKKSLKVSSLGLERQSAAYGQLGSLTGRRPAGGLRASGSEHLHWALNSSLDSYDDLFSIDSIIIIPFLQIKKLKFKEIRDLFQLIQLVRGRVRDQVLV